MTSRTRLLVLSGLFYPQRNGGGPPVSVHNLVTALAPEFAVYVISKNHEIGSTAALDGVASGWNDLPFGRAYYFDHGTKSFRAMLSLIRDVAPNVVYINSFFSYDDLLPVLFDRLGRRPGRYRVVITPRGEFATEALTHSRLRKLAYILLLRCTGLMRNVEWQVASNVESRNVKAFFPRAQLRILPNITHDGSVVGLPRAPKLAGSARLVYIARVHPHKNLLYALRALKYSELPVTFDIFGPIEDQAYWRECEAVMAQLPANVHVQYCGTAPHEGVAALLIRYDALLLPSRSEAYGQSIAEALLAGRPVIIGPQTPWGWVHQAGCGYVVDPTDDRAIGTAVQQIAAMDEEEMSDVRRKARDGALARMDLPGLVRDYATLFNNG